MCSASPEVLSHNVTGTEKEHDRTKDELERTEYMVPTTNSLTIISLGVTLLKVVMVSLHSDKNPNTEFGVLL